MRYNGSNTNYRRQEASQIQETLYIQIKTRLLVYRNFELKTIIMKGCLLSYKLWMFICSSGRYQFVEFPSLAKNKLLHRLLC